MRKRGVVILMAAALTASVPATALADQVAGQIALNGEAASEDVVDEESPVDMDQTEEADDENHEESEDAGLEETDEAEAGTEESDPEESEPEESEEEVKEAEKSDESGESEMRMLTQRNWNRKKMSWRTRTQKKAKRRR